MPDQAQQQRKKPPVGAYLLPNLFTASCLFCGFYAMTLVTRGHFVAGSMVLFLGLLADTLDGRAARLTGTESDFGKQFDSLADMVTSGVAPAWMAYHWGLHALDKLGLSLCFLYVAATAMRLARFNCLGASSNFKGLPCPAAAATIASMIWCIQEGILIYPPLWSVGLIVFALACLMVSDIAYYGFKTVAWKGRYSWLISVGVVVALALLYLNPPLILLSVFSLYILSGLVRVLPHSPVFVYRLLQEIKKWWSRNQLR